MGKQKLHLGCGRVIKKGWMNIDIVNLPGVDKVMDIEKTPYPFKGNQFDEVETHHVLEHVRELVPVMEEIYRICAPGAIVKISVPYFASPAFWLDPTHKRCFNIDTFKFFDGHYYVSKAVFKPVKRKLFYFSCRSFMKQMVLTAVRFSHQSRTADLPTVLCVSAACV